MSRYIDADALKEECFKFANDVSRSTMAFVQGQINAAPTADVAPIGRGEWLLPLTDEPWRIGYFCRCSVCNKINNGHTLSAPNFCENCGAKMNGERGSNDE